MGDPETILHRIAAEGARLLRTERVFINLLNDPTGADGWTWYSAAEVGRDPWPADEAIRLGEGIIGKAIAERRPFITGDYLADERFVHRPGPDRYTAELGLLSAMAAPIFDGDDRSAPCWRVTRARRLQRGRCRAAAGPGQAGRHRPLQRPAHRGTRRVARRDRISGRRRAGTA